MASMNIKWKLSTEPHSANIKRFSLQSTNNHPLQSINDCENLSSRSSIACINDAVSFSEQKFIDPLSALLDGTDPLTSADNLSEKSSSLSEPIKLSTGKSNNAEERERKMELLEQLKRELEKFSTNRKLNLSPNFFSSEGLCSKTHHASSDRLKSRQSEAERIRNRLDYLNSSEKSENKNSETSNQYTTASNATVDDFLTRISELKEEIEQMWKEEQKVKALNLMVQNILRLNLDIFHLNNQVLRMLSVTTPELFFPFKFVHIVFTVLECFAELVHSRLVQLTKIDRNSLLYTVQEECSSMARNWFQKVSTVRELVPRIYLESALIPCYLMLPKEESYGVMDRLISMCKGIGDPIASSYARLYVIICGQKLNRFENDFVFSAYRDCITSCQWGWDGGCLADIETVEEELRYGGLIAERVFTPVFSFILQNFSPSSQDYIRLAVDLCSQSDGIVQYILLKSIVQAVPKNLLQCHCIGLLSILDVCFAKGESSHEILLTLGHVSSENVKYFTREENLAIFTAFWNIVQRVPSIQNYLRVVTEWMKFLAIQFELPEMDQLLQDVSSRLSSVVPHSQKSSFSLAERKMTSSLNSRFSLVDKRLASSSLANQLMLLLTASMKFSKNNCVDLFNLTSFRGLLTAFQREAIGGSSLSEMTKLLEGFLECFKGDFTDPDSIALLISLFSSLHNAMNALTTIDERRQIQQLTNAFIRRVNFGKDFESQLEFYSECRGLFSSLDAVLEDLVQHVLRLQIATLHIMNDRHSSRTDAFEHACSAFCFITIPSLSCPLRRLQLYILSGSVAMVNNCMGQGDACVKNSIQSILDIASDLKENSTHDQTYHDQVTSVVTSLVGYLIGVPDPPDVSRPLYFFRGLLNALRVLSEVLDIPQMCRIYLAVFKSLCTVSQPKLPYYLHGVNGIDSLYGSDDLVRKESEKLGYEALSSILALIGEREHGTNARILPLIGPCLCETVHVILTYGDSQCHEVKNSVTLLLSQTKKYSPKQSVKNALKHKYTAYWMDQ